jgi:hypothetical protein
MRIDDFWNSKIPVSRDKSGQEFSHTNMIVR